LIAVSLLLSLLFVNTTYAYPPNPDGSCNGNDHKVIQDGVETCQPSTDTTTPGDSPGNEDDTEENDDELTCAIEKMGWIPCPLIETSGRIGDQAFQYLASTFLEIEPELVASAGGNDGQSGTYTAWELARNIANIMFIIAFLI